MISSSDIMLLFRQLSILLTSGISLAAACEILEQKKSPAYTMIHTFKIESEGGKSFSESLKKFPQFFDPLTVNLVRIAEQTGTLDTTLERISLIQEKSLRLKKSIQKALFYPLFTFIFSLCVTFILLVYIVPHFSAFYQTMGHELPFFTRVILAVSKFIQHTLLIEAGIVLLIIILYFFLKKHHPITLDHLILKIPFIGSLLQKKCLARFCDSLATLIEAGIPLTEGLKIAAKSTENHYLFHLFSFVQRNIVSGHLLHKSLKKFSLFPSLLLQMVKVGEETGKLSTMLGSIAQLYEENTDHIIQQSSQLLEPLIMIGLGVLIGSIVIAMYLPLFQLGALF